MIELSAARGWGRSGERKGEESMDHNHESVLEDEAKFADEQYRPYADKLEIQPQMFRKYADPRNFWDWRELSAKLMGDLQGKVLLDYGCGMGEEAMYFAKLGATVTAIDISTVGIEITKKRAVFNNLEKNVEAIVMRVDPTKFDDSTFDIVHGLGILHHVNLESGLQEIHRILKPGGRAVFLEPMGNIRWVEKVKIRTAKLLGFTEVTEHEEALKLKKMLAHKSKFTEFQLYPYHLFSRVKRLFPIVLHNHMKRADYQLLRIFPFFRYFAGAVVVYLKK